MFGTVSFVALNGNREDNSENISQVLFEAKGCFPHRHTSFLKQWDQTWLDFIIIPPLFFYYNRKRRHWPPEVRCSTRACLKNKKCTKSVFASHLWWQTQDMQLRRIIFMHKNNSMVEVFGIYRYKSKTQAALAAYSFSCFFQHNLIWYFYHFCNKIFLILLPFFYFLLR